MNMRVGLRNTTRRWFVSKIFLKLSEIEKRGGGGGGPPRPPSKSVHEIYSVSVRSRQRKRRNQFNMFPRLIAFANSSIFQMWYLIWYASCMICRALTKRLKGHEYQFRMIILSEFSLKELSILSTVGFRLCISSRIVQSM